MFVFIAQKAFWGIIFPVMIAADLVSAKLYNEITQGCGLLFLSY
jgi:hypothetical protein